MPKLERLIHDGMEAYIFECPGCGMDHMVPVRHTKEYAEKRRAAGRGLSNWGFNGDLERPTFNPSLLVRWNQGEKQEPRICHSFIREGQIEFLSDCTHALAGKTVPLAEVVD